MDALDLDYFKTLIEEQLDDVREGLGGIGDATAPIAPDVAIGRLSRLDSMQMQQMALDQKRRLEERERLLKAAMDRIERGTYGRCSGCRREIEFTRLRDIPEVQTCLRCAGRL